MRFNPSVLLFWEGVRTLQVHQNFKLFQVGCHAYLRNTSDVETEKQHLPQAVQAAALDSSGLCGLIVFRNLF